jgi:flagellum-specific ATP synthase
LDGHFILSRNLAQRFHYPALDILLSISRLSNTINGSETKKAVGIIRRLMADYADTEDLINVGAYKQGTNSRIDEAIAKRDDIENFLNQAIEEKSTIKETMKRMGEIAGIIIPEDEMQEYIPKMLTPFDADEEDLQDYKASFSQFPSGGMEIALSDSEVIPDESPMGLPLMDF